MNIIMTLFNFFASLNNNTFPDDKGCPIFYLNVFKSTAILNQTSAPEPIGQLFERSNSRRDKLF